MSGAASLMNQTKKDSDGKLVLIDAIKRNDESEVKRLIDAGVDVNETDDQGKTALFYAAEKDNDSIVLLLIDAGADVEARDDQEKTALCYAVQQSTNESVVRALIDAGADVSVTDNEGETALFYAVQQSGNETVVRALIDAGAHVNRTDNKRKTALFYAVQQRGNETVVCALIDAGADVNETDDQDKTALFYAAEKDNDSIVLLLIDAGADVEARDDQEKTTLFYAAANKSIRDASILAALVEKGNAVVNACDNCGRTPLFYAITTSIVSTRYLLDHVGNLKADFNVRILTFVIEDYLMKQESPSNPAPLSEVFDLLIEKGLQRQNIVQSIINLVFCKIPLLFTANERETIEGFPAITQDQVLKTLKEAKQYLDEGNEEKAQSILTIENKIKRGEIFEAIEMLSKLGADPNSADSAGNTVLHYATLLPMMGVPQETVMKICDCLMRRGLHFNTKNHQSQTPLLFCLSENHWKFLNTSKRPRLESLVEVCKFLLRKGFALSETSQSGETVFHLLMKLSQQVLNLYDKAVRQDALCQTINLLKLFSSFKAAKRAINIPDDSGNFPLHLWAALTLSTPEDYTSSCNEDYTFEKILRTLLECFLKCGANVNARNNDQETPLHSCKTWVAVKLLIDAGANANDLDSSHRSPLLVATVKGFYLDIADLDPKDFWKTAIEMGLDPCATDKDDNSVLDNLLRSEAFVLVNALLEVACKESYIPNDKISSLLKILDKDESTSVQDWKPILIEVIESRKCQSSEKGHCPRQERVEGFCKSDAVSDESHSKTYCGVSLRCDKTPCSELNDQSVKPKLECAFKRRVWCSESKRYRNTLEKVYRREESKSIETIWYHKEPIAEGGFGFVFAGISEDDGREVAIKRMENQYVKKEEMINLTRLAECEQVVRYLYYFPQKEFSYVILELMEGTLDEYLTNESDKSKSVLLCKDIVMGLNFLHEHNIVHRDLKPQNILYKRHPKLCLKIADFGLSCLIESSSTKDNQKVGTRCWRAPEVLKASSINPKMSDIFSCGLLLHYILSGRINPFRPANCANKSPSQVAHETEENLIHGKMEGWAHSLSPEAAHLVMWMLESDEKNRPNAINAVKHPWFFLSKDEKVDLLITVGNQPEFSCTQDTCALPSTAFQTDLENSFEKVIKYGSWKDPNYVHMPKIYAEMTKGSENYNTCSVIELVQFIRYAYMHISEMSLTIRKLIVEEYVFLEYFPDLVTEVYQVVTTHGWDETREIIAKQIPDHVDLFSHRKSSPSCDFSSVIPWTSNTEVHRSKLAKVANKQEHEEVDQYWYHKEPIKSGQFGNIYAGINKMDGREVAIKRIDKMRIPKPEHRREIRNLTLLADCRQVVFYLIFFEMENFSYVILELMEGNLDELLDREIGARENTRLCKDVVTGMKYLHDLDILHRDLKPGNILYKVNPRLCLKIADFGLSRRMDSTSSLSVYGSHVGSNCWMAPEVLKSICKHSRASDIFSCGLIIFYILSIKRHPFSPVHCSDEITSNKTEANLRKGSKMEGWNDSISNEATHLVNQMLEIEKTLRPTAGAALNHPLFWSKKKKLNFLEAVGNQPEFECSRDKRLPCLSEVERDLETKFNSTVQHGNWDNQADYKEMPALFKAMTKERHYDTTSVVELVRFIRDVYADITRVKHEIRIELLLEDFVFLEYFPALVVEVYKAVITHGWDQTREEIAKLLIFESNSKQGKSYEYFSSPEGVVPALIPWTAVSNSYKKVLAKVARRQECDIVGSFWYHKDHIGSGAFSRIFAGISEKDGREVAIKRIEKVRMSRPEDKREIRNLTALADCQHVVRFLCFFEDQDFSYVVLELMEGNLEEYLNETTIDASEATRLCKDVVMGLKFLHKQDILHRDLKPQNILYKKHPKLCLKIADFGLSCRIDSTSKTVYGTNAGTRCWIAPEVLMSTTDHSKSSDMFSCGLLLHYILSGQKHPFCAADFANKSEIQVAHETEDNIIEGKMKGWDNFLSPEASHLVRRMIESTVNNRPTAKEAINHPLFWAKEKKIHFLETVGNQPEFECPRARRWSMGPLAAVETDLEYSFSAIVKYRSWNDSRYLHMPAIYTEMTKGRSYDTRSVVELVRFIRNIYEHIPYKHLTPNIAKLLLEDFVFLEYFPALVMEVYKAVTTHGWDQTRYEIKYAMRNK